MRWPRTPTAAGLVGAIAWTLAGACGDSGGTGGGTQTSTTSTTSAVGTTSGGAGGGDVCGLFESSWPSECNACMTDHCCAEWQDCAADANCRDQWTCDLACEGIEDWGCLSTCAQVGQGDDTITFAPNACMQTHCGPECHVNPIPCEAIHAADGGCDACLRTECCAEWQAAYGLDALLLSICQLECNDAACLRDCEQMHPDGTQTNADVNTCLLERCSASCGLGSCADAGACEACLEGGCCQQPRDFLTTPSFGSIATCLLECGASFACADCFTLWPLDSVSPAVAYYSCLSDLGCASDCFVPAVATCGRFASLATEACLDCAQASCCDAGAACGSDSACVALRACVELCGPDTACGAQCRLDHAAGAVLLDAVGACTAAACPGICPWASG